MVAWAHFLLPIAIHPAAIRFSSVIRVLRACAERKDK